MRSAMKYVDANSHEDIDRSIDLATRILAGNGAPALL
jgi:hypothetical protein